MAELAEEINLEDSQYRLWLKSKDGNPLPASATDPIPTPGEFTVPNVGYVDVGTYTYGFLGWMLIGYKNGVMDRWKAEGLQVRKQYPAHREHVLSHMKYPHLYKYGYIGHGDRGGSLVVSALTQDSLGRVYPKRYTAYRIAEMHLVSCNSNDGSSRWRQNVSTRGFLRTVRGKGTCLNFWTGSDQFIQEPGL